MRVLNLYLPAVLIADFLVAASGSDVARTVSAPSELKVEYERVAERSVDRSTFADGKTPKLFELQSNFPRPAAEVPLPVYLVFGV